MDRKQNKKEYKRSRSRSEKRRKKEKKRKNKDKKKKDKHSKRSDRRHSDSRSSSESSRSSRSNSLNGGGEENKVKIIPLTMPLMPKQIEGSNPTSSTPQSGGQGNAIPSSILQFVNKAQQNISTTSGANPLREKRNAFSSPPKINGFSAPVAASGGLEIPGLGGLITTSNSTSGGMLDISIAGMGGLNPFGLAQDTQIIGNKIPPALQKQYIHALRVYIGNIPDPVDVEDVCKFVYEQMANAGGLLEMGNPIQSKKHDPIKKFIFLQLRSIEETSACMELDGIIYRGKSLRFRRPKDFGVLQKVEGTRPVPIMDKTKLKIVQTQVENTYNKLQIMNLPETFSEEHVMQLLGTYGD